MTDDVTAVRRTAGEAQAQAPGRPLPPAAGEAAMWAFAAYGLFFAALPDLARAFPFDLMFYGEARPEALLAPEADRALDFYAALVGAMMLGWFVTAALALRSKQRFVWDAALAGVAVWFVADTAASLMHGFWQNGVSNLGLAVLAGGILLASRPAGSAA